VDQPLDRGGVGRRKTTGSDVLCREPGKGRLRYGGRCRGGSAAVEIDRPAGICHPARRDQRFDHNLQAGLFPAFATGGGSRSLTRPHLSTGKLGVTSRRCRRQWSSAHEGPAFVDNQHSSNTNTLRHGRRSLALRHEIEESAGRPHDVVPGIDMQQFTGDAEGITGHQPGPGLADLFVGDVPPQR
jgi:hypothetical protein